MAENGYGWEELFIKWMCRHFQEDYNIETRIVSYHRIYEPQGKHEGGREKALAVICRKVITARKQKSN